MGTTHLPRATLATCDLRPTWYASRAFDRATGYAYCLLLATCYLMGTTHLPRATVATYDIRPTWRASRAFDPSTATWTTYYLFGDYVLATYCMHIPLTTYLVCIACVGAVDGPCVPRTAGCWAATYYSLSTTSCSIRSTCHLYASRASDTARGCGHYPPLATDYLPHTTTTTTHYARLHTCSLGGA